MKEALLDIANRLDQYSYTENLAAFSDMADEIRELAELSVAETATFEIARCGGFHDSRTGEPLKHTPHLFDWSKARVTRYCAGEGGW